MPVLVKVKNNVVSWSTTSVNTLPAAYYVVEVVKEMDDWTKAVVIRTKFLEANVTGVSAGQKYSVRVRAGNGGGLSSWTSPVTFTATESPTAMTGMYSVL